MKSKTIILSSEKATGRGILTLFEENDLLKCKLRLYNTEKLNKYAKIGVYHNNEVSTANLLERDGVYLSSLVGNFDINGDFYAAIIKTDNNNEVLLSGGTYAGFYFNDNSVFDEKDKNLDEENISTSEQNDLSKDEFCDKCINCKYKEYFYSEHNVENLNSENVAKLNQENEQQSEPENETPKENVPTILEQIVPQFKYIFENFPKNDELCAKISNSKFVSMGEGEYSLGAIYENDNIKYICYAVKCAYNSPVPDELGEHYQWLPLDADDPLSDGYYIVFQDASDLKIIEV